MNETPKRCYWVRDAAGHETLIPHCWGSINGPAFCTCQIEGSQLDRAKWARFRAEQEVLRLREKLDRQAQRYEQTINHQSRQYAEIQRLRARIAELEGDRGQ